MKKFEGPRQFLDALSSARVESGKASVFAHLATGFVKMMSDKTRKRLANAL
jgi:hypothetical protein